MITVTSDALAVRAGYDQRAGRRPPERGRGRERQPVLTGAATESAPNLTEAEPTRTDGVAKPTILTVDDDPAVSQAITRDLRRQYGAEYQIVRATSGAEALDVLAEFALRGRRSR